MASRDPSSLGPRKKPRAPRPKKKNWVDERRASQLKARKKK